jgi:hypothetical protein
MSRPRSARCDTPALRGANITSYGSNVLLTLLTLLMVVHALSFVELVFTALGCRTSSPRRGGTRCRANPAALKHQRAATEREQLLLTEAQR